MMYGLTMTLKNEIVKIAPQGRVNCVAPGWVDTPMAADALKNPKMMYQALATSVALAVMTFSVVF
jgi:NAD(P)-dependent dehydrogenase (short-subunit alcohol dehydrogenase family)